MRSHWVRTALTAMLVASLSAAAIADDYVRVEVTDAFGNPAPNVNVSYSIGGGEVQKPAFQDGAVSYIPAAPGEKLVLISETAGGRTVAETQLPTEPVWILLDADNGRAKMRRPESLIGDFSGQYNSDTCSGTSGQLPNDQPGVTLRAAASDISVGTRLADGFVASTDGDIQTITFWGSFYDYVFNTNGAPGPGDEFMVAYYDDNGTGSGPGSLIASHTISPTPSATGNFIQVGDALVEECRFDAVHPPVAVSAGTTYWMELCYTAPQESGNVFLWQVSNMGDGRAAKHDGQGFRGFSSDMAFCLDQDFGGIGPAGGPNDDCANAESISGDGTFAFDNTNATMDGLDHAVCDFASEIAIDRDVWFLWEAGADGEVTIDTCDETTVDTKLAIYDTDTCPGSDATLLDCNDDACALQSQVTFTAVASTVYLFRLGTYPGADGGTGTFTITTDSGGGGGPANDDCADAIAVAVPSVTPGTTVDATVDAAPDCGTSVTAPGVWYSVIGTGGLITANLCNGATGYDSKLSVYSGGCAVLDCVGANDDTCGLQSQVSWNSDAGVEYLILVHGFSSNTGSFELVIEGLAAFPYTDYDCKSTFEDISTTGTELVLGDDDGLEVGIGFTFNFNGTDHTNIGVGSNGYLTFGADLSDFSNDIIPDDEDPNDLIAPLWDDYDPTSGGTIHHQTLGPAGDQRFIAQWTDVPQFNTGDANTFQAVLFERTGAIEFRYGNFTPEAFTNDITVGLENADGTNGTSRAASTIVPGDCIQYFPFDTSPTPCQGDGSLTLSMPGQVQIGEWFCICAGAPAGNTVVLFVSTGEGPVSTPFGDLCLDFPITATFGFTMPSGGEICFNHYAYCDPALNGAVGYMQFVAFDPNTLSGGVSNQTSITVTDGNCN